MFVNTFDEHYYNGLCIIEYHILDHMGEDTQSILNDTYFWQQPITAFEYAHQAGVLKNSSKKTDKNNKSGKHEKKYEKVLVILEAGR